MFARSLSTSLLALALSVAAIAQLPPGSVVLVTQGHANGRPQPAANSVQVVDTFRRTATSLTILGLTLQGSEAPFAVWVEDQQSFLLGTWIPGAWPAIASGNIYRVTCGPGQFPNAVATRLTATPVPAGPGGITRVGDTIYFTSSGLFSIGEFADCRVWRLPAAGGTPVQLVDLAGAGAPGTGGPIVAVGSDLHVFPYLATVGGAAAEHWRIAIPSGVATRVGTLPSSLRLGNPGRAFAASDAAFDPRTGLIVLAGVTGEVLWRSPGGVDQRHRALPGRINMNSASEFWGAVAIDTDTGGLVFGDKERHLEFLHGREGRFYLNAMPLFMPSWAWIVGMGYVPAGPRCAPEGPDGCPEAGGGWPCGYVSERPAAGSPTFALTLESAATQAILLLGAQNTSWAGSSLPLDLAPLGAPNCWLGTAVDVAIPALGPDPRVGIALPAIAMTAFAQWLVLDPANPLGIALSEARRLEIR
jgi:hypothetical protein